MLICLCLLALLFASGGESKPTIPFVCPTGSNAMFPNPFDCSSYIQCSNGVPVTQRCPANLEFNPTIDECDWPSSAGCVLNFCYGDPCQHGGTCINGNGNDNESGSNGYTCTCASGFTGEQCQDVLTTAEPTTAAPTTAAPTTAEPTTAAPTTAEPTTAAPTTAAPTTEINTCTECTGVHEVCISGICQCEPGYAGDPCEDIDECAGSPCVNCGTCDDLINGYNCSCLPGYHGKQCESSFCLGCDDNGNCLSTPSGYVCVCNKGWAGPNCNINPCKDVDTNTTLCDSDNGQCVADGLTDWTCVCKAGWTGDNCKTRIKPNYIIIVVDDLGSNDVGWHPQAPCDISTPRMQAFVEKYGIYLDNNNVQMMCTPSRHALLFSRHEVQDGLQHYVIRSGQRNSSPVDKISLPEALSKLDYTSYLIGKYHLGNYEYEVMPTGQGFDHFYGYLHGESDHYTRVGREPFYCYKDGIYSTHEFKGYDFFSNLQPLATEPEIYSTDLFKNRFIEMFENHILTENTPFLFELSFNAVHWPLQVPGLPEPEPGNKKQYRRNYAAMVNYLDIAIGELLDHVVDSRVWENTIVVFTTDNGGDTSKGASNYPLRGSKFTLFEGGLKGAGFVASPFIQKMGLAGTRSKEWIHISDWYPTFLHLAGGTPTDDLVGHIIWSDLSSPIRSPRTKMLLTIDSLTACKGKPDTTFGDVFDTSQRAGVRTNKWKLLTGDAVTYGNGTYHNLPGQVEQTDSLDLATRNILLFDIENDPTESVDVSQDPENHNVVVQMLQLLADYKANLVIPAYFPPMDLRADPANNPNATLFNGYKAFWPWANAVDGVTPDDSFYCLPEVPSPAVCLQCNAPVNFGDGLFSAD